MLSVCNILSLVQVKKLNAMVAEKKSSLAPVIKELRQLRQKCQVGRTTSTHSEQCVWMK